MAIVPYSKERQANAAARSRVQALQRDDARRRGGLRVYVDGNTKEKGSESCDG
jgi:hypothetical protein